MVKLISSVVIFIIAIKFGVGYLGSKDFQKWADENNATWTCSLNKGNAELAVMLSKYDYAIDLYKYNVTRCSETPKGIEAEFRMIEILRSQGKSRLAIDEYKRFAETHEGTDLAEQAIQRARILSSQN